LESILPEPESTKLKSFETKHTGMVRKTARAVHPGKFLEKIP
jgi:hypothetical protein